MFLARKCYKKIEFIFGYMILGKNQLSVTDIFKHKRLCGGWSKAGSYHLDIWSCVLIGC